MSGAVAESLHACRARCQAELVAVPELSGAALDEVIAGCLRDQVGAAFAGLANPAVSFDEIEARGIRPKRIWSRHRKLIKETSYGNKKAK